ncbi:MAG: hypothetical protein R3176_02470, partial [Woeseiaceae bacterium]|nr:hypothetical protein [Woeseiaceae bacterium]
MTRNCITGVLTALLLFGGGAAAEQDLAARYGHADMNISCDSAARQPFTRGLLQLHSFAWADARASFAEAARADADCAMAYWGLAMTRYDSLHEAPTPAEVAAAEADLARALAAPTRTERETAYIRAAAGLFRDADRVPRIERDREYSAALAAIATQWPEDEEAQILHALSLLALARRGADPGLTAQAAAILEPLFAQYPGHPGIAHYLIHAYDDAGDREPGLAAARRYAGIAPLVTHAQHMPSHIFAGLGLWQESNASNAAALEADPRYYHALMYVVYGHLQLGQWQEARRRVAALERFAASPDGGG